MKLSGLGIPLWLTIGTWTGLLAGAPGSGFQANEEVAIHLVTQSQNQGPATSDHLTTANTLGQVNVTIGVRCPVGTSPTHQATASGLTTNRTSTAGSSC
jgi:hypothetical protein